MNRLILSLSVLPLYGQVSVHDVGTDDLPDWITGEEPAVSSGHAVLIATQQDTEGDVIIRVVEGSGPEPGTLVFDGEIETNSSSLEVGSIVAATLQQVQLRRPGPQRVRVYATPEGLAQMVWVVLEPGSAAA